VYIDVLIYIYTSTWCGPCIHWCSDLPIY